MKQLQFLFYFFVILTVTLYSQDAITGTWELIYVDPQTMSDTDPRGITNFKIHFTNRGKVFNLMPDEKLTENSHSADYTYEDKKLTILDGDNEPYIIYVTFPDSLKMMFNSESGTRIFRRLLGENAASQIIEPKSLQLVRTDKTVNHDNYEIKYDTTDYSSLPLFKRLTGTWETIEYREVPQGEMPPYGFFNDIWVFTEKTIMVQNRAGSDTVQISYLPGKEEIFVTAGNQSLDAWKVSFNKWGHMVIDISGGKVLLKLITKETASIPEIPLKVVLLKMKGEG